MEHNQLERGYLEVYAMTSIRFLVGLLLVTLLIVSGCSQTISNGQLGNTQHGSSREEPSHHQTGVSTWDSSAFPILVKIDEGFTPEQQEILISSLSVWNQQAETEIFRWEIADIENYIFYGMVCEPQNGQVYVFQTQLGENEAGQPLLGLTTRFFSDDRSTRIKSAMVEIDLDLATINYFFVTLHEFGHVLGLTHDSDFISIMYPYALDSIGVITPEDITYVKIQAGIELNPSFLQEDD